MFVVEVCGCDIVLSWGAENARLDRLLGDGNKSLNERPRNHHSGNCQTQRRIASTVPLRREGSSKRGGRKLFG